LTSDETVIAAALIGSAPGWAAVYATISNRRALKNQTTVLREDTAAQTEQIKSHIDTSGVSMPAGERSAEDD
jgi:hypothetical protein